MVSRHLTVELGPVFTGTGTFCEGSECRKISCSENSPNLRGGSEASLVIVCGIRETFAKISNFFFLILSN